MMSDGSWKPLLEREAAEEAWTAIRAIGDHLRKAGPSPALDAHAPPGHSVPYPALSSGSAGIALFLRRLAEALPGEGYGEAAAEYLDAAVDGLSEWPLPAALHGGFSGVAWTVRHLAGGPEDDGGTEELDELLISVLGRSSGNREYDLISGLAGLGVYGVEALPNPFGRHFLERVVERLDELHEDTEHGVTWFTPPERVPESQRHVAPSGYYNLGVAHGVPAVIVLLAACRRAGVAGERSRRLLGGALGWLFAQRQASEVGSSFSSWVGEGIEPTRSRLAWCYGDPGVGAAILVAGRAVGSSAWENAGVEILRHAARRDPSTSEVKDAGLCHGSAGLAQVFNRAWQATGDEELRRAALYWYRQTLALRRPGEGVAGFLSWEPDGDEGLELRGVPGLLTGASGVGLVMLAAVTDVEPAWDRVLALSVAAGAQAEERTGEPAVAGAAEAVEISGGPAP